MMVAYLTIAMLRRTVRCKGLENPNSKGGIATRQHGLHSRHVQGPRAHVQGATPKARGHDLCRVFEPWAPAGRLENAPLRPVQRRAKGHFMSKSHRQANCVRSADIIPFPVHRIVRRPPRRHVPLAPFIGLRLETVDGAEPFDRAAEVASCRALLDEILSKRG